MNDLDIYSSIFDIIENNAKCAGHELAVQKECYMCLAESSPSSVDILKLSREKDNELFLRKAYLSMLTRLIDKKALESWSDYEKLPPEDFQRRVVNGIKSSEEFFNSQIRIKNNIYSANNSFGGNLSGLKSSSSVTIPEKLMKTYRKMPEFMKKTARKIMGIG